MNLCTQIFQQLTDTLVSRGMTFNVVKTRWTRDSPNAIGSQHSYRVTLNGRDEFVDVEIEEIRTGRYRSKGTGRYLANVSASFYPGIQVRQRFSDTPLSIEKLADAVVKAWERVTTEYDRRKRALDLAMEALAPFINETKAVVTAAVPRDYFRFIAHSCDVVVTLDNSNFLEIRAYQCGSGRGGSNVHIVALEVQANGFINQDVLVRSVKSHLDKELAHRNEECARKSNEAESGKLVSVLETVVHKPRELRFSTSYSSPMRVRAEFSKELTIDEAEALCECLHNLGW